MDYENFTAKLAQVVYSSALDELPLETILAGIPRVDELRRLKSGDTVLIRADLDVVLSGSSADDAGRLESLIQTFQFVRRHGQKPVLLGHIGRDSAASLKAVCRALEDQLASRVQFLENWFDPTSNRLSDGTIEAIRRASPGTGFMFENTRRYEFERVLWKLPRDQFADVSSRLFQLASDFRNRLSACEVNEAIAASNLDFSSAVLPLTMDESAMGFFLHNEMRHHIVAVRSADFVVMSGSKADKLDQIDAIVERGSVKTLVAAGALAMALVKARENLEGRSISIGRAETDPSYRGFLAPERLAQAKAILRKCAENAVHVVLPVDYVLEDGTISDTIPAGLAQLDIGPKSRLLFAETVETYQRQNSAQKRVLFFNGAFGMFDEDDRFAEGTRAFIRLLPTLTRAGVLTYVGGGEGRRALLKYGRVEDVTHAFTAGGTVLKSLANRHVPYLRAMYLQNRPASMENIQPAADVQSTNVAELIARFRASHRLEEIERIADLLGESRASAAIEPLLERLSDERVQENADVEDAVCSALVQLGVMEREGNLVFQLVPHASMAPNLSALVQKYATRIPSKYKGHSILR